MNKTGLFGPFPLVVNRQPRQGSIGLHTHNFKELVIILSGRSVHFSGNDGYEIMAGDCFMVEEAHGYRESENLSLVNILFIPDRLSLPWNEARKLPGYHAFFALEPRYRKQHNFRSRLRLSPPDLSRVSALIDDMEAEITARKPGFEILACAHFMQLIGFLSRAYARMQGVQYSGLLGLSEVLGHLERNYTEEIRLPELAKMAQMSESRLLRSFRSATGHAPIDYLVRLRLRHAGDLLRQETQDITAIAYKVGFNDSNYFSRQFRRVMGVSPREYRKGRRR
ncbi:MAG: helix-turn-helix domain-containing protein [Fibrobacterota bacterium]